MVSTEQQENDHKNENHEWSLKVVDEVRTNVAIELKDAIERKEVEEKDCDHWDEEQDGVNWLANDFGLFDELRAIASGQEDEEDEHGWDDFKNVSDVVDYLDTLSIEYKRGLFHLLKLWHDDDDSEKVCAWKTNKDREAINEAFEAFDF